MTFCQGCGYDDGVSARVQPPESTHCGHCPPWTCEDCGELCSVSDLCSCWIDLSTLPLADVKSLLATADLSLDHNTNEVSL